MAVKVASSLTGLRSRGLHPLAGRFAAGGLRPSLVADFGGASGREGYAKPLPVLGPELVVNGRFDDASAWSKGLWTISGGLASLADNQSGLSQPFTFKPGATYRVTWKIADMAAGSVYIGFLGGSSVFAPSVTSDGQYTYEMTAKDGNVTLYIGTTANTTVSIDNISVREITGYRAVRTTFTDLLTHSRSGNAIMVDRDGLLKWAPHNFLTWSEDFTNAAWTDGSISGGSRSSGALSVSSSEGYAYAQQAISVATGVAHTIEVDVTCDTTVTNVPLRAGLGASNDANLVDFSAGETKRISFAVTPTSGTLTIGLDARNAVVPGGSDETGYIVTLNKASAYRSDLGGMVNNPDTGDSYVPTTNAAKYLSRRGHHVWDGSAWVNKGLLHESEARTNLLTASEDLAGIYWGRVQTTVTEEPPEDGRVWKATTSGDGYCAVNFQHTKALSQLNYAFGLKVKKDVGDYCVLTLQGSGSSNRIGMCFNLASGTVELAPVAAGAFTLVGYDIDDTGDGYYMVYLSANSDAHEKITAYVSASLLPKQNADQSLGGSSPASVIIKHPQFEQAATPSSYTPTNGATATRAADTFTIPAANLPYSPSAMSGALKRRITYADTGTATEQTLFDWRADASNRITITLDTSGANTGKITLTVVNGGVSSSVTTTTDLSPGIDVIANIAWRITASEINIALNGTAETAVSNTAGIPNLSAVDATLGGMGALGSEVMWGEDTADAGMAEASA